jgi:hypothetical protein
VRHAVLAVARAAPATQALLAGCHYPTGADPCPALDDYIARALEQAKRDEDGLNLADWGTAVHRFTEPNSPPSVPERFASDVKAYHAEMGRLGIETVDTEVFVVNDEVRVAGTLDHLYRLNNPKMVVVGDKKTSTLHPVAMAIQVAAYAGSVRYDPATGGRSPLGADPGYGYIVHIPLGRGTCEFIPVSMPRAHELVGLAYAVQQARRPSAQRDLFC